MAIGQLLVNKIEIKTYHSSSCSRSSSSSGRLASACEKSSSTNPHDFRLQNLLRDLA